MDSALVDLSVLISNFSKIKNFFKVCNLITTIFKLHENHKVKIVFESQKITFKSTNFVMS